VNKQGCVICGQKKADVVALSDGATVSHCVECGTVTKIAETVLGPRVTTIRIPRLARVACGPIPSEWEDSE
jgi:hypothetical protein